MGISDKAKLLRFGGMVAGFIADNIHDGSDVDFRLVAFDDGIDVRTTWWVSKAEPYGQSYRVPLMTIDSVLNLEMMAEAIGMKIAHELREIECRKRANVHG